MSVAGGYPIATPTGHNTRTLDELENETSQTSGNFLEPDVRHPTPIQAHALAEQLYYLQAHLGRSTYKSGDAVKAHQGTREGFGASAYAS